MVNAMKEIGIQYLGIIDEDVWGPCENYMLQLAQACGFPTGKPVRGYFLAFEFS